MAGKRKAEGIALLSVYGGDDDDGASQASSSDEEEGEYDGNLEKLLQDTSSPQADGAGVSGIGVRTLGDDGELATEIPSGAHGIHSSSPGNLPTTQPENTAEGSTLQASEAADGDDQTTGSVDGEKVFDSQPMELDILNDFLPPPPAEKYSGDLQAKFSKYLGLKKTGKSLNEQLRNTKGYRNPDFLQSAVRHYDIDHIGSCFKKETFDPHGYDQTDYFDAIALEIRREAERKELERRQTQRVDFVRNSLQTAVAVVKPIVSLVHKVTTTVTSSEMTVKTEGRSSKKSKWDKVDVEGGRTTQPISTTADAIAVANAHAALLTASANAGAGYASFAQQRRREAEEKSRIIEKVSLSTSSKSDRKTERS